jgi:hypothetical protein
MRPSDLPPWNAPEPDLPADPKRAPRLFTAGAVVITIVAFFERTVNARTLMSAKSPTAA